MLLSLKVLNHLRLARCVVSSQNFQEAIRQQFAPNGFAPSTFAASPYYRKRAVDEGRKIAIDAFEVDQAMARRLKPTLESQMQENLWKKGHNLPWDQSKILKALRLKGR